MHNFPLSLVSISISSQIWHSFPSERSLADLSVDARELQRKILKNGLEVETERAMLKEILFHMQHSAIQALVRGKAVDKLVLDRNTVDSWLSFIEGYNDILLQNGCSLLYTQPFWYTVEERQAVQRGNDVLYDAFQIHNTQLETSEITKAVRYYAYCKQSFLARAVQSNNAIVDCLMLGGE